MRAGRANALRTMRAMLAGVAALALSASVAASMRHFQEEPPEDPGDGMEELGAEAGGAHPRMTREEAKAIAAEVAAREPKSPDAFRALEARVRAAAAKARESVVGLLIETPEGGGAGSGTIISPDGWVLTAGHVGMQPGRAVRVFLADGTELPGTTSGQLLGDGADVGLVKIDTKGRALTAAPLGASAALRVGDPIIVFGHPLGPEITPWRPPPLRVGRLVHLGNDILSFDAPLSPGDSGGPVFDLEGRIVGVNSVASDRPDLNAAISSELAKRELEELKKGDARGSVLAKGGDMRTIMEHPAIRSLGGESGVSRLIQEERRRALLETLAPLADALAVSVVGVIVDSRDAAYGVVVDAQGHVLTKLSELGGGVRRIDVLMSDGLAVRAKQVASDPATDLALLETGVGDADPMSFDAPAAGEPVIGDAVITVGRGMLPVAVGHRSLARYVAGGADNASRAFLGVALRDPTPKERESIPGGVGQMVTAVREGSGAAEAGIAVGDAIVSVEGVPLQTAETGAPQLRMRAPGEHVKLVVARDGKRRDLSVRLQRPVWMPGPGNIGAPLSRRATGFGDVIVHDGIVPAECVGGPIVDSQGRLLGLNIARADRTKTYALPLPTVQAALQRMQAKLAAGQVEQVGDPGDGLKPQRFGKDGRVRLGASSAKLLGPTNGLLGDDDFTAIEGWGDADDGAVWRLEIPAAGRYEVALDARGMAGGSIDVFFGNEQLTVRVPRSRSETDFRRIRVGESFQDAPGTVTVRVHPLGSPRGPVMGLRGITIERTDLVRTFERAFPYLRMRDPERLKRELERELRRERAGSGAK